MLAIFNGRFIKARDLGPLGVGLMGVLSIRGQVIWKPMMQHACRIVSVCIGDENKITKTIKRNKLDSYLHNSHTNSGGS